MTAMILPMTYAQVPAAGTVVSTSGELSSLAMASAVVSRARSTKTLLSEIDKVAAITMITELFLLSSASPSALERSGDASAFAMRFFASLGTTNDLVILARSTTPLA